VRKNCTPGSVRGAPGNRRSYRGAKGIAGGWWRENCKHGIFGFMSKPALNIDDLTPEERLRLIEELWDSLSETPGTVPLTNAQREELDRRLNDLERSGPEGIPWDQVLQQIRSRSR
jgi:putative addiction module component (TIGR02574 family)